MLERSAHVPLDAMLAVRRRPVAFVLVALVAALALACGDDGKPGAGTPTSAARPAGATVSGQANGAAGGDLRKLAADLKSKAFSVTYDFTGGSATAPVKGTLTTTQAPPKTLVRLTSAEAGGQAEVSVINDGSDQVFCSKGAGSAGLCLKASAASGSFGQLGNIANIDAVLNQVASSTVAEGPAQTIAGRQARCLQGKSGDRPVGSACFDTKDGLLLSVERMNAAGTAADFSARATNARTDIGDNAFAPPYPLQAVQGQR